MRRLSTLAFVLITIVTCLLTASCPHRPETMTDLVRDANQALAGHDLDEATRIANLLLDKYPGEAETRDVSYRVCDALFKAGRKHESDVLASRTLAVTMQAAASRPKLKSEIAVETKDISLLESLLLEEDELTVYKAACRLEELVPKEQYYEMLKNAVRRTNAEDSSLAILARGLAKSGEHRYSSWASTYCMVSGKDWRTTLNGAANAAEYPSWPLFAPAVLESRYKYGKEVSAPPLAGLESMTMGLILNKPHIPITNMEGNRGLLEFAAKAVSLIAVKRLSGANDNFSEKRVQDLILAADSGTATYDDIDTIDILLLDFEKVKILVDAELKKNDYSDGLVLLRNKLEIASFVKENMGNTSREELITTSLSGLLLEDDRLSSRIMAILEKEEPRLFQELRNAQKGDYKKDVLQIWHSYLIQKDEEAAKINEEDPKPSEPAGKP